MNDIKLCEILSLYRCLKCTTFYIVPQPYTGMFFKRSQSDALQEEAFLYDDDDDVPHLLKKARLSNIKPN